MPDSINHKLCSYYKTIFFDGDETLFDNNSKLPLITEVPMLLSLKLDIGTVRTDIALYMEWLLRITAVQWFDETGDGK